MTSVAAAPSGAGSLAAAWIRATFAGWALGFLIMLALLAAVGAVGLGETQFAVGLGMGAGVGFTQGRLLARRIGIHGPWLSVTALGVAAPFLLWDALRPVLPDVSYSLPALVALGGLVVGALQARLLKDRLSGSASWIAWSVAGWSLAAGTVLFNERWLPRIPGLVGAALYVGIVMIGGVLLGAAGSFALSGITRSDAHIPELHPPVP